MKRQTVPFRSTHAFSEFFLRYIEGDPSLKPYYETFPDAGNFGKVIAAKAKTFPPSQRTVLADTLTRQYASLTPLPEKVKANIESLRSENTFTVITGHQLNIFTGPLYFIYKILTVINACREMKERYPANHFVPVYWMASEDHDYEEIKSFRLYGQKYVWETKQTGAVGRFETRDFDQLLQNVPGDISIFRDAYKKHKTLADAVRHYVNRLFGEDGLIVVDADEKELKQSLTKVIEDDLFSHNAFKKVTFTNQQLEGLGFHPQVNPREINFFYLDKGLRGRIEPSGDGFAIVDTNLKFSADQLRSQIGTSPEKFSPNVILRPLYQELILPNLAYVGGPAELIYWLQLKPVFDHFNVPFPVLLPRNFALVIDTATGKKLDKTGLGIEHYFREKNDIFNHWVSTHSGHSLTVSDELKESMTLMTGIAKRAVAIDPTLGPMVKAEAARLQHALEKIEKKMLRAEKRNHLDRLRQIEQVKDTLFPSNGLQERTDNFLNFFQQDPAFIKQAAGLLKPFDFSFNVLRYE